MFSHACLALGLSAFVIGLAKKVLLADRAAGYASPVFDAALTGHALDFCDAWGGALAYTFQLYFDFSGYSDMAIGLALMFGLRLPLNFFSPYKATSIIDFWRRWHMTLSRFLRDYLYIPLGGNRRGSRQVNLMITMLLGGLWHGAGWTFVFWGGLHGVYLVINNRWRDLKRRLGLNPRGGGLPAGALTFLAVVVAWVFFRAESMAAAWGVLAAMAGLNGFGAGALFDGLHQVELLAVLAAITWGLPNTCQLLERGRPVLETPAGRTGRLQWAPSVPWAVFLGFVGLYAVLSCTRASEFLYFQF